MAGFKRPQRSLIALGVVLAGALSSVGCSSSSTSPTVSEAPEPSTTTTVAEVTSDDVSTTSIDPTTTTTPPTTLPATPAEDTTTTTPQTLPATGNHTFPSPTTWAALLLLSAGLLLGKSTRRRI